MASQFSEKLSDESAKNLFQLSLSVIKKIGKITLDEVKIRNATDKYAENYLRRFCFVKILGMQEPFPLKELYTEVEMVSPTHRIKERIITDLENKFRNERGNFSISEHRENGIKVANEKIKLNVLGAPGSGKSTFLRKIGLECLVLYPKPRSETFQHKCIPVLVELKRFKTESIDLFDLIQKEFEIAGFPESHRFLKRALKDGKLLILLDGLDEVPESKLNQVLECIKDFTDEFYKNRFITSCRTAFYKNYLSAFTDVEISSFRDDQIIQFINNWFYLEKDLKSGVIGLFQTLLFKEGNEATLELSRTPLLLAFLCMSFDVNQRLPSNRSSLYKQALTILMHKWAAEKRIHNEDIYQDLNVELETEMLASLAAFFYEQDKIFFYSKDLKKHIKNFLSETLSNNNLNVSKVLEAIEIQQGILVERSFEIYSFSHLTIQEYLTAHFYNSPMRIHDLINNHLFDKRWREVFLLLTNIGDPNDILLLMLDSLNKRASDNKIISQSIEWIHRILPSSDDFELDACKRTFLASLLLRYKRYDSGFPHQPERIEVYANQLIEVISPTFYDFFILDLKQNMSPKEAIRILNETTKWVKPSTNLPQLKQKILSIYPERPLSGMLMGSRQTYRRTIIDEFYNALEVPSAISNRKRNLYDPMLEYMEAFKLLIESAKLSSLTSIRVWQKMCKNVF